MQILSLWVSLHSFPITSCMQRDHSVIYESRPDSCTSVQHPPHHGASGTLPHPFPNRDVKRFEVLGSRINQHIQNHTNSSELFSSRFAADIALFCKEAGLVFIAESTTWYLQLFTIQISILRKILYYWFLFNTLQSIYRWKTSSTYSSQGRYQNCTKYFMKGCKQIVG